MLSEHYLTIVTIHSYWRWAVLLAAVVALAVAAVGLKRGLPFQPLGRRASLCFVGVMDVQFLLGLTLYFISPIVHNALMNMAAAMKQHEPRFFAVEHITSMLIALASAHVGSVRIKRAATDHAKYRLMLIWYGVSLVLILGGIPWWRPLLRF